MSRWFKRHATYLVVRVEATYVRNELVAVRDGRIDGCESLPASWDSTPFLEHRGGVRLAEELVRRIRELSTSTGEVFERVGITLPGTLEGHSTILRSTRLGIHEPLNVSDLFAESKAPECYVLNDAECLALGEARHGTLSDLEALTPGKEHFAYVLVDEGVGSALFVDGQVQRGAGSAGHLGRLVVEPSGAYNPTFASRGPLEVFAARPWISQHIVGEFLAEQGKHGTEVTEGDSFRAAVAAAASAVGHWNALSIEHIAEGLRLRDPIALTVLEEAARYLGLAVDAIIAVANPPVIILGGAMIEELPGFADMVFSYSRRFAWRLAWERMTIRVATLGRRAQALGAGELLLRLRKEAD